MHVSPLQKANRMHTITIENGAVDQVWSLVPDGVESYMLFEQGTGYLNVRTDDDELIATLQASARY